VRPGARPDGETGPFRGGVALAAAVIASLLCSCSREPRDPSDAGIVAVEVDNVPISLRDVKREILSARGYSPTLEERGPGRAEVSGAVRRLVERSVVLREGARRGVAVSFASLEEEVMRYRADFPEGGLRKALLQVGLSEEEWRDRLGQSLLYRKSAEAIASSLVSVTPQEVEKEFQEGGTGPDLPERIRVRQFLFESAERAMDARGRLLRGTAPGAGGDPAAKGVDLGFFALEELPPKLPRELFRMKAGEVSEPVFLDDSVSLFRVEEREPARPQSPGTARERIRETLLSARREAAFRRWLADACAAATVRMRAELLEKLAGGKR